METGGKLGAKKMNVRVSQFFKKISFQNDRLLIIEGESFQFLSYIGKLGNSEGF